MKIIKRIIIIITLILIVAGAILIKNGYEMYKNAIDEILELYLNTSYYGDGYYTIKEACKRIF